MFGWRDGVKCSCIFEFGYLLGIEGFFEFWDVLVLELVIVVID